MEDRETPPMHKYGESKTTRIVMETVPQVTAWAGRTKYQAARFFLNRVYMQIFDFTGRSQGRDSKVQSHRKISPEYLQYFKPTRSTT